MYKNKKILALIPARGGSKGLKGKNIRPLLGKPLIAWSIEHGLKSRYVDKVIVSTDSHQIASVGLRYGAQVPFMRPKNLATDKASSMDVIEHALDFLKQAGEVYDIIVLLEPTSPLRQASDVDKAIERLVNNRVGGKCVMGVAQAIAAHPAFDVVVNRQGLLRSYDHSKKVKRRQDLSKVYFFEGTVYVSFVDTLLKKKSFYHDKTLPYVVPKYQSFEVDDLVDWVCIEAIMKNMKSIQKDKHV